MASSSIANASNSFQHPSNAPINDDGEGPVTPLDPVVEEEVLVVRQLPWMAIAMVMHAVVLLFAAFIVSRSTQPKQLDPLEAVLMPLELPTPPEEEVPPILQEPIDEIDVVEVVAVPVVEETVTEVTNINESPDFITPSETDAPSLLNGPNDAFGFGGGGGGGKGGSGGPGGGIPGRPTRGSVGHPDRVDAALQWLADHQHSSGMWRADQFLNDSIRLKRESPASVTRNVDFREDIAKMRGSGDHDTGISSFNVGLTGLALLAFVTEGVTNNQSVSNSRFSINVHRAVSAIRASQDAEGCFGARDDEEYVYSHAICTMAFAELGEVTLNPIIRARAQRGVDFIVRCQNPGMGWRYGVQPRENDTSVTAWMVLALKSAKSAGLEFDSEAAYGGAEAWFTRATGKDDRGYQRTGYDRPGGGNSRLYNAIDYEMNPSMDACAVMSRLFMGTATTRDPRVRQQAQAMVGSPAEWYLGGSEDNGPWKVDMYYWYYASLALYQLGDDYWSAWERNLIQPVLLKYQRGYHPKDVAAFGPGVTNDRAFLADGTANPEAGRWMLDEHGSWDPVDPWGSAGGRVYSTAINALTLQVYYRYTQISKAPAKTEGKTEAKS